MRSPDDSLRAPPFSAAWRLAGKTLAGLRATFVFLLPQIAFFIVLTVAWETMALWLDSPLAPRIDVIYREFLHIAEKGFVFREIGVTFLRMSLGFLLALAIALPLGIASAVS